MTTYADPDDVLTHRRQPTTDARFLAAVEQHLADVTAEVVEAIGYSFLRQPAEGTESWITTGSGCEVLHAHEGLATLTTVEIRSSLADSWVELDSDYWTLEGRLGEPLLLDGEPAFHVVLLPGGSYSTFPAGRRLVRLTGARGWESIPTRGRSMTVAIVRQRLGMDPTGQGGPFGPEELGGRTGPDFWPKAAYDVLLLERGRHRACSM